MIVYGVVFWTVCAGALLVGLVVVVRTAVYLIGLKLRGTNNSEQATDRFWDLVNGMESEMVIHDDGEAKSFYDDPQTVGLVRATLRADPDRTIQCVFNRHECTRFGTLSEEFPSQVEIRYAQNPEIEVGGLHYKIVDRGAMAYLSRHSADGTSREFEFFDYRWCPPLLRPSIFRKFQQDFDQRMVAANILEPAN